MTDDSEIHCPKCGSTQVHADQRGWSIATGFIGSGKVVLTCLKCGYRFRPGQTRTQTGLGIYLVGILAILILAYLLTHQNGQ